MGICNTLNRETISCFVDGELTPEQYRAVEEHLLICRECAETVEMYRKIAHDFEKSMQIRTPFPDEPAGIDDIFAEIRKQKQKRGISIFAGRFDFSGIIEFFRSEKIFLQVASFAAIVIVSVGLFQFHNHFFSDGDGLIFDGNGPSAIVNSLNGDLASVMILETQENKHTIIWYKES